MPRNITGGNKHKKGKNYNTSTRELGISDNESTFYGLIQKALGGGHFAVHCNDSEDRIATLRGSLKRNTRIAAGDLVLISLREFEQQKTGSKQHCDILVKYSSHEITQLKRQGIHYKNTGNVFSVTLEGDGFGKENKAEGIQFDSSYANINITSSNEAEPEGEDELGTESVDEEEGEDEYGPRKLIKQSIKDIADMSDGEEGEEGEENEEDEQ
jgi:translation initiation factor 1A